MKRFGRLTLGFGALASIVLSVALLRVANAPPFHVHRVPVWVTLQDELLIEMPAGSGRRSLLDIPSILVALVLVPLPLWWARIRWSQYATAHKVPRQFTFSIVLLILIALAWVPIVAIIGGGRHMADYLAAAFIVFVVLCGVALPIRLLLWAGTYLANRGERQRQLRLARNQCVFCGYALEGNLSGICPECGRAAERQPNSATA